jgi:PAS domain-containing protein
MSSDEAAMKTSATSIRDDRPTASAPVGARNAVTPLAPLLAGARARGVADALELIGAAAALLDEQGEVLHLNARARSLLGDHLVLVGGRLRARDHAVERTLAAAIDSALRDQVASRVALGDDASVDGFGVRIMPVTAEADDSFQLLRAVAILEPRGAAARAGFAGLN